MIAESEGRVVGFVMGELFVGEYGIPETTAALIRSEFVPNISVKASVGS